MTAKTFDWFNGNSFSFTIRHSHIIKNKIQLHSIVSDTKSFDK